MKNIFARRDIGIMLTSLILSVYTTIAFHFPAFSAVIESVEEGWNGVLIFVSFAVLMLAVDYLFYYLLLYSGRIAGKIIIAFTLIADAVSLYFINTYEVLITDMMMGNVFNTRYSEASGFFSWAAIAYVLFLGVLPCIWLFANRCLYSTFKRFIANIGASLLVIVSVIAVNMNNILWIDNNSSRLGSLLMPWSYTVNTVRYYNKVSERNRKEIKLPDAEIVSGDKSLFVLVIGESARRENFSLYGYGRKTNPLLEKDSVKAYVANSAATYTTAAVKAIIDHKETGKLYEILPNYLYRSGVDVVWRTSNWGEPPLRIEKFYNKKSLMQRYPDTDARYDGILLEGLETEIRECGKDKQLIVLHTSTSHGPTYNQKYPAEFEKFAPVCETVEIAKAGHNELINAYDNTILYTDYLLHSIIEILKRFPDRRCCMLFVSDHGESLGESNLFMHGMPMNVAPKEQYEIPFIVWLSDKDTATKELDEVGQYHVFHSVMNFLGIKSPIYNEEMNIFTTSNK